MESLVASWSNTFTAFDNFSSSTVIGSALAGEGPVDVKVIIRGDQEMKIGESYRFFGKWGEYRNKKQFQAASCIEAAPLNQAGIIKYLKSNLDNIGDRRAHDLYDAFGANTLEVMRNEPETIAELINLKLEQTEKFSEILEKRLVFEQVTIETMELLSGEGVGDSTIQTIVRQWGLNASARIRSNPYELMTSFDGIGWKTADKIWKKIGKPPWRIKRQLFAGMAALEEDRDGHTYLSQDQWREVIRKRVTECETDPDKAMRLGVKAGVLDLVNPGGLDDYYVTKSQWYEQERMVAVKVAAMVNRPGKWPTTEEAFAQGCSEHQAEKVGGFRGSICILGGGPGTGKTFTGAKIISQFNPDKVKVCAPTGKAAVRMQQALDDNGLKLKVTTIHRLLEPAQGTTGFVFSRHEGMPIEAELVVLDEGSMPSLWLFFSLLMAIPKECQLLILGDVGQLTPIQHGAPLRDLIRSMAVPYAELTEVQRNAGEIVKVCQAIQNCTEWPTLPKDGNLTILHATDATAMKGAALTVAAELKSNGVDLISEMQVLVATNDKTEVSRDSMNRLLRASFNDNEQNTPFWPGDKIICLTNDHYESIQAEEHEDTDVSIKEGVKRTTTGVYIANGEIGTALNVEWVSGGRSGKAILRFENPQRTITQTFYQPKKNEDKERISMGSFTLANAITCHKSQGSEWPYVVVMLDPGAMGLGSREWLKTAVSRAKVHCYLIGELKTAARMCQRVAIDQRKTFLAPAIAKRIAPTERKELAI